MMKLDPKILCITQQFKTLILALLCYPITSSDSGGSRCLPLEGNFSCRVPTRYQPLYDVNATEESTMLLLTEGRCYLLCLQEFFPVSITQFTMVWSIVLTTCTDFQKSVQ